MTPQPDPRMVSVPADAIWRLILAADSYGVKHLDSDDLDQTATELQAATEAMKELVSTAPIAGAIANTPVQASEVRGLRDELNDKAEELEWMDAHEQISGFEDVVDLLLRAALALPVQASDGEPVAWLRLVRAAAEECARLGPSNGSDTPENRKRCAARSRLMKLTTPTTILAAFASPVSPDLEAEKARLRDGLKHYACTCGPGECAMSDDGGPDPVDEKLCGRTASAALEGSGR